MAARRPYVLAEATWPDVLSTAWKAAVLPWGSAEAHNVHLPFGTDTFESAGLAEAWAEAAWAADLPIMALPPVPFGAQPAQAGLAFHIDFRPSSQFALLSDVVRSLDRQGIGSLFVLNGHGANSFAHMARELHQQTQKCMVVAVDWFRTPDAGAAFDDPGEHAGQLETSLMMALRPDLVDDPGRAGRGENIGPKLAHLNRGWAWAQRGWLNKTTKDAGLGDPRGADPAKGAAYKDALVARLMALLREVLALDRARF